MSSFEMQVKEKTEVQSQEMPKLCKSVNEDQFFQWFKLKRCL